MRSQCRGGAVEWSGRRGREEREEDVAWRREGEEREKAIPGDCTLCLGTQGRGGDEPNRSKTIAGRIESKQTLQLLIHLLVSSLARSTYSGQDAVLRLAQVGAANANQCASGSIRTCSRGRADVLCGAVDRETHRRAHATLASIFQSLCDRSAQHTKPIPPPDPTF
jgi:hypothetical protein